MIYRQRQVTFARFLFCFREFLLLYSVSTLLNSFVKDDQPE